MANLDRADRVATVPNDSTSWGLALYASCCRSSEINYHQQCAASMKMYITVSSSVVYTNSTMRQCVYSGEAKFTMIHVRLRHLLNIHKQSVSYLRSNKNKGVHHTNKTR